MINRTKIKNSIYDILDEDPKKIQKYIDKEAKKTAKQKEKEKEKRNKRSNITDVNLQENIDNQEDNPYNRIVIHTEKDNLVHNYFHYFDMYWDAGDCMSSVILKLPKTDIENTKYWITYTGDVMVYLGNEINTEMHKSQDQNTSNTYWDLQGMKPIFKGEIGRIKEYNKELEIHIDSIGKRFKQKIPDEFRQAFINNQNVRDAFQAICEFLGVKYICPPPSAQSQDEQTDEENTSSDGTENDVNSQTSQEQQLASAASTVANNVANAAANAAASQGSNANNDAQNNESSNTSTEDAEAQNLLDESGQQAEVQNGFQDISFDANGSIVHGSTVIETSPNLETTLLSFEEAPLEKYLTDTTFVSTDVKKFLNGEFFDTVHNNILNYGAITIQPGSLSSSNISDMSSDVDVNSLLEEDGQGGSDPNMGNSRVNQLNLNNARAGIVLGNNLNFVKKSLSYDEVNAMTPKQAQAEAAKTGTYYHTTIVRLRARAAWGRPIGPNTDYSKYNY
jgi:hypothetical protein